MILQLSRRHTSTISTAEALKHLRVTPKVERAAFIARSADVMGNVKLGSNSSVWYNCVLRADINSIEIGNDSNVQDGSVIHLTRQYPVKIGNNVSVGHNVTLHGCTLDDDVLVGNGSVLLDNCRIGPRSIVGAGSLVSPNKEFPPESIILGSPAKVVRKLTPDEIAMISLFPLAVFDHTRCLVILSQDSSIFFPDKNGEAFKSFYALGFAALVIGNAVDVKEFCKDRPVGLYCSPDSIFQKIECPSGDFFTCQKAPNEFCQERGILKQHGFRGGIARCVPRLDPAAVASFCKPREKGVYCWGDFEGNIRVHCPSGLIYKCADNPTPDTKKCNQTTPTFAQCTTGGGGGGAGNCTAITVTIPETITQTKVVTSTSTQRETVVLTTTSVQRKTVTVNPTCPAPQTSTLIIPTTVTNVVPSTLTNVSSETTVDRATSTIIIVDSSTRVNVQTSLDVVSTKITETVSFETSVTVIPQTELINSMTVEVLETMTEFWTVTPTQTEGGGAAGTGTPTVITITVDPTTTYVIPTSTSDGPGPAGSSVTEITIVPSPTDAPCPSEGFQTSIPAPPGANFNYVLSAQPIIEGDARPLCRSLGGQLALIESTDEHWYLGQHICQPVWYSQWQGNVYQGNGGCIALYPGGASAVPTNGCFEQLIALCKVPA